MSILINLNMNDPTSPKLELIGEDEFKDELKLFLDLGIGRSLNGFNNHYLSEFIFNSESGHHKWDFMFKDEREYNSKDWDGLMSLNLAWDCWLIAKNMREF
nr:MAG TPA: hypothetical protein [Caudoviricetes sp.]